MRRPKRPRLHLCLSAAGPELRQLMSMGEPASDSSLPEATAPSASPEPARKTPTENAAASLRFSRRSLTSSRGLGLLPLTTSSSCRLFCLDSHLSPASGVTCPRCFRQSLLSRRRSRTCRHRSSTRPAPTQPFDVLTSTETGKTQATTASAAANATAASTGAAVAAASAATAATTPVAAAFPPAVATRPTQAAPTLILCAP